MRLGRRASLLVVFCLLISVVTANAECAWIVWSNIVVSGSDKWVPVQATGSRQECGTIMDRKTKFEDYVREQYRAAGRTLSADVSYLCLPDSVDPRGPKAGRG